MDKKFIEIHTISIVDDDYREVLRLIPIHDLMCISETISEKYKTLGAESYLEFEKLKPMFAKENVSKIHQLIKKELYENQDPDIHDRIYHFERV